MNQSLHNRMVPVALAFSALLLWAGRTSATEISGPISTTLTIMDDSELVGDVTTSSPEWLLIRELLEHRDEIHGPEKIEDRHWLNGAVGAKRRFPSGQTQEQCEMSARGATTDNETFWINPI